MIVVLCENLTQLPKFIFLHGKVELKVMTFCYALTNIFLI